MAAVMWIVRVRPTLFEGRIQPSGVVCLGCDSMRQYKSKFKVLIFTGRDSLVGLGHVVAGDGCLLRQPDRAADEHGRVHERGQGEHRVRGPGELAALFCRKIYYLYTYRW